MNRNTISILIISIVMFASLATAINFLSTREKPDQASMAVANQLFENGKFQEATQVYEQLISQGIMNSAIYYNLGNAYLVQGDHGRAILNYQRAARLDPRDPDINANLAIARAQSGIELSQEATNPIQSLAKFSSSWMTVSELGIAALVAWFVLGLFAFALRQLQSGKLRTYTRYGVITAGILFLISSLSLGSRMYVERTTPEAVIVEEVVTLNSDPGEEFATEYELFSGTEVKLLGTQGSWAQLTGNNEAIQGWIPLSSIETVSWSPALIEASS